MKGKNYQTEYVNKVMEIAELTPEENWAEMQELLADLSQIVYLDASMKAHNLTKMIYDKK